MDTMHSTRVNLNIYPFDTGSKLLVSCSHLQESYYRPFAYNSAIDSSIRRLHRMIGPWRVFSAAREREARSHWVRLVNYSLQSFNLSLKIPFSLTVLFDGLPTRAIQFRVIAKKTIIWLVFLISSALGELVLIPRAASITLAIRNDRIQKNWFIWHNYFY